METFGVTPIEAAFDVIGLTNSKLIMDFIFLDTKIGIIVFIIGFLFALWTSMVSGAFAHLGKYLFLFFTIWFLFVIPSTTTPNVTSTMETGGFDQITADEILTDEQRAGGVNPILTSVSEFFNAFTHSVINVLTTATQGGEINYLNNPFLVHKLAIHMNKFTGNGIRQPVLRQEVLDFFYTHYLPAIKELADEFTSTVATFNKWWPGHTDVIAKYSPEGVARWTQLRSDLVEYIYNNSRLAYIRLNFASLFSLDSADMEDELIVSLFNSELKRSKRDVAVKNAVGVERTILDKGREGLGGILATAGSFVTQFGTEAFSEGMMKMFPFIEGYASLIMYTLFPFTLLIMIFTRSWTVLWQFVKLLFWVKTWPIMWAVIEYASLYIVEVQRLLSPNVKWFWEEPYFNIVTAVFIIMTPIVSLAIVEGAIFGVGQVATAVTLLVSQSVGAATKLFGGSVKGALKSNA